MDSAMRLMREGLGFLQAENYGLAEESYAEALEVLTKAHGESHPMVATVLGHLARACKLQNKREIAAAMFARQLRMLETEEALQALVAERATAILELTDLYHELGRHEQAEALEKQADGMLDGVQDRLREIEITEARLGALDEEESEEDSEEEEQASSRLGAKAEDKAAAEEDEVPCLRTAKPSNPPNFVSEAEREEKLAQASAAAPSKGRWKRS